jgi:hypothetical protein
VATTPNFAWDEIPSSAAADVPYRVNILGRQVDATLEEVDGRARGAGTKNDAQDIRLDDLESWNTDQDTRLEEAESLLEDHTAKNSAQDTTLADHGAWLTDLATADEQAVSRMEDIEAKDTAQDTAAAALAARVTAGAAVKSVRLESGAWVWDLTAGTHYLIPDDTGQPVIRQTPWPMPLPAPANPALNW